MRVAIAVWMLLSWSAGASQADSQPAEVLYMSAREAIDDESNPPPECRPDHAICIRLATEVATPDGPRWRGEWAQGRAVPTEPVSDQQKSPQEH